MILPLEKRLVLVIDSDASHAATLAGLLEEAGYEVRQSAHEASLPILRESRYDAVVVRATPEPSTLSPQDRLGEFVLRYVSHVVPALLPRTVILTSSPPSERNYPAPCIVVDEPYATGELLSLVAACVDHHE